jgi:tRNA-specific 2-thiouridylase
MNSLGINKSKKATNVVVAMSGGVDSSVVAALLKDEGYNVTGITLKLYNDSKAPKEGRQCCAGQDILDAKRVSEKLDINHKILFYQKKFKSEVIDSFIDSYVAGETPIPCVQCNQTVKFRDLFKYAKDLNADALVTGHYVSRVQQNGKANMYRAKDQNRDQSYFLFSTSQEQLDFLRFPLGEIDKLETRSIAQKLKLNVEDKPDSQDICFVPNGDYASVIEKFRPNSFSKGNIKNMDGEVIGVHDGIINYTIGQRKGIGISDAKPLYVVKIVADKNEIIVGAKKHLIKTKINLKDLNIITDDKSDFEKELFVKVRSTGRLIKAKIDITNTFANVDLLEEEHGIAPGQACVFYSKNEFGYKVLGGGWIKS